MSNILWFKWLWCMLFSEIGKDELERCIRFKWSFGICNYFSIEASTLQLIHLDLQKPQTFSAFSKKAHTFTLWFLRSLSECAFDACTKSWLFDSKSLLLLTIEAWLAVRCLNTTCHIVTKVVWYGSPLKELLRTPGSPHTCGAILSQDI